MKAFFDCSSLASINLPPSVTEIGEAAFWGCSSLTTITLPPSVTKIGEDAFSGCSRLTEVRIPKGCDVQRFAFELFSNTQTIRY
ncbi:MAG: leucine-rich repeat domain-containing protein [Bacteroidaceae bacterium]|nr:leucine-rich repeat domain-containing protein [Bacteroidaceae bacterium]